MARVPPRAAGRAIVGQRQLGGRASSFRTFLLSQRPHPLCDWACRCRGLLPRLPRVGVQRLVCDEVGIHQRGNITDAYLAVYRLVFALAELQSVYGWVGQRIGRRPPAHHDVGRKFTQAVATAAKHPHPALVIALYAFAKSDDQVVCTGPAADPSLANPEIEMGMWHKTSQLRARCFPTFCSLIAFSGGSSVHRITSHGCCCSPEPPLQARMCRGIDEKAREPVLRPDATGLRRVRR